MRAVGRALLGTLKAITYGWILAIWALLRSLISLFRHRRGRTNDQEHESKRARTRCVPIDDPAFVKPDPLIYDQYYLMDLGLNVTWDNPDFAIFRGGVAVPAHQLQPDTDYDVVVRVWNASTDCPVVKMPVNLSYLTFGVGTVSHPITTGEVDVGVMGAPNNPAFVHFPWRTPAAAGHYCLQAQLDPVADAQPANNVGQHNTNVVAAHSPATFAFALRNGVTARRQFVFDVDTYELEGTSPCIDDSEERRRRQAYHREEHPVPAGWTVDIQPPAPVLDILEEIAVLVTVTPPSGFLGRQVLNVHTYYLDAYGARRAAGGVTVTVEKS